MAIKPVLLLLCLSLDVLFMVGQSHIEIKSLVSLRESKANKSMLSSAVIDPKHEVARGIRHVLHGGIPLPRKHRAGSEELACVGIFQSNFAFLLERDDLEPTRPDFIGL
jgi:hypothetical protein